MAINLRRKNNKSDNPDENDKKLHDWAMNLVDDGRARRRQHEAQWWENIATYQGDLWAEFDITLQELVEPPKPDHRVRMPVNLAQPAIRTEYAKLLKNRPIVDCLARSNEKMDLNAAKVGDKIIGNYIEKDLQFPKYRRKFLQWLLICGLAGIFVDYDPSAAGEIVVDVGTDGQPVFNEEMVMQAQAEWKARHQAPQQMALPQGELRHAVLSPWQIVWDFSKLMFEEAAWCIVTEVFDVDYVYQRWGVEVEGGRDAKPGVMEQRTMMRWDITQKPIVEWSKGDTQKLAEIHRMFVLPGHRYFPNGAEIVYDGTQIIDRTNFPFAHGELPVAVSGHVPVPWAQYQSSILPQIKPMILELSKTESQLIENRNLIGNPPWIEYEENRVQGAILNKPGGRIRVSYMPNVPEPHPVEMPDIASYVRELVPMMREHIQEVSGQSEVSQGKVPQGARAGVTIAYLQEEDDTKLGPTVQEFEEAIERCALLQIKTMAEKYDVPRTVRIYKQHSEPEIIDFYGGMLEGVAGVEAQAGSALPRSKAAKQQYILDLWDRQIERDPRRVRDMLELSQGEPDDWEMDVNQAERENRRMLAGETVPVIQWQNHAAHHYGHRRLMKSPEYDELPKEIQAIILQHDEEHSAEERSQAQEQMVQQMLSGGQVPGGATGAPPGGNGVTATPAPEMQPQEQAGPPVSGGQQMAGSNGNVQDYQPQ